MLTPHVHMLIVQDEEEEDEEEEEELEDELLDCLMCRNETLVDFLRKHIKFHHMIQVFKSVHPPERSQKAPQEDSIVEKLFSMHFPNEAASIETQTQVAGWFLFTRLMMDSFEGDLDKRHADTGGEGGEVGGHRGGDGNQA